VCLFSHFVYLKNQILLQLQLVDGMSIDSTEHVFHCKEFLEETPHTGNHGLLVVWFCFVVFFFFFWGVVIFFYKEQVII